MSRVGGRRIATDVSATEASPSPIWIPRGGVSGGGKYGETITDVDRAFAILREPVGFRSVCTVAKDVFDNWFTLELEDAKEDESKAFDKMIQKELMRLRAKRELTEMAVQERGFGYAIIVLGFEDEMDSLEEPLKNPTALQQIKAFGARQITSVKVVKDTKDSRYGLPEVYSIEEKGRTGRLRVHHSRAIHFATRHIDPSKDEWKGESVLDPIWDDLVTLRNIRWSMGQTMFRYGSGFPVFTFTGAEKAKIQEWVDAGLFGDISNRTYFAHNEKQTIDFKGLQGRALDPQFYYLAPMEHISCGTGIPLAILRGVQAGALTGSEVNQMEYYGLISDEQSAYEYGLRKLVDLIWLLGKGKEENADSQKISVAISAIATDAFELPGDPSIPSYTFDWRGGFELDEEKKARIELMKIQRLQLLGQWHTRNELRQMEDPTLEDLPEGQGGEEILGRSSSEKLPPGGQQFQVKEETDGSLTVTERPRRHPRS